ncbi:MAG TPA: permease [Actinomycetota bacterium]
MAVAAPDTRAVVSPLGTRPVPIRTALVVGGLLVLGALGLRLADPQRVAWVRTYLVIFGSLLIQALPFVMFGAVAAALVEVFVPVGTLERLSRLPRPLQLPAAALAGLGMPICECGSVPVARRLVQRGLMPSAAVTFMLAAPVLNPVVVASTFVAYRGRSTLWTMVGGRFLLGMLVAIAVGWLMGARSADRLLKPNPQETHHNPVSMGRPEPRWRRFFGHLGNDFLFMGRYLILGATIAATIQTFLPASVLGGLAERQLLAIVAMMALAALLSLCSESDAFVAASFVQFGPAPQLAFLVFGPMVDLKLIALYAGTFQHGFVRAVVVGAAGATLAGTLWVSVVFG